jgi:hypothetical protein
VCRYENRLVRHGGRVEMISINRHNLQVVEG